MYSKRSTPFPLGTLLFAILFLTPHSASGTMPPAQGPLPQAVRDAFASGALEVPPAAEPLGTSGTQPVWRIPVLLIGFADRPLTYSGADFEFALFDTTASTLTGSVHDYYRWVSENRIDIRGQVVANVQLPHAANYYAYNSWGLNTIATPNNIYGMIRDALISNTMAVDWSNFDANNDGFVDVLWVVHAGLGGESDPGDRSNIWSITSRLSSSWRLGDAWVTDDLIPGSSTQYIRIDRFCTLPELSGFKPGQLSEIGVYCHEFGHVLGLPDLYDTSQLGGAANAGPGNWSLMATGGWGGNGVAPERPTHMGAWPTVFLGWRQTIRPSSSGALALAPLAEGGNIVELWFQGESNPEHYLLENRRRTGFDQDLPDEGLVIYQLDEAAIGARLQANRVNAGITPGLRLVEADGDSDLVVGRNRGDANDPFPGALGIRTLGEDTMPWLRTFAGGITQLEIRDIALTGDLVTFTAQVEAPGWLEPQLATASTYDPFPSGTLPAGLRADDGTLYLVQSELQGGIPQVMLRSRVAGVWEPPYQVSAAPSAALDAAAALLPGGDLAIVWSDARAGGARLRYRTRIGGVWTPESEIATPSGDARNPAIVADDRGIIHIAWLQNQAGPPRLMLTRFAYTSPFGQMYSVADTTFPGPPTLALRPDRGVFVLWSDRHGTLPQIRFSMTHPDSGIRSPEPLSLFQVGEQTSPRAVVDPSGTLHTVWIETSSGSSRLYHQQRPAAGYPEPHVTVAQYGSVLAHPTFSVDPLGALHLAYERQVGASLQIRYQRWRPGYGWDLVGTNITDAGAGDATSPALFAQAPGWVDLAYAYHDGASRLMIRQRQLGPGGPVVAVDGPPPVADGADALALLPNPLRAGQGADIRWAAASVGGAGFVDVYDIAGRRVAQLPFEGTGATRTATLSGRTTGGWSAGVYFARVRGTSSGSRFVLLR